MKARSLATWAALVAVTFIAACAPSPTATPIGQDAAVDRVRAENPLFAGVGVRDPDLIGQAAWYEVTDSDDGWTVTFRIGWGDCPAGCISEHRWTYQVTADGAVSLVEESGDPLPSETVVEGTVTAGPTCPVVTDPPDPSCADRPVEGAELVLETLDGDAVTTVVSDRDGAFSLEVAPGAYRLVPQPVEGLMGTAEPVEFTVELGQGPIVLTISYDTGIR